MFVAAIVLGYTWWNDTCIILDALSVLFDEINVNLATISNRTDEILVMKIEMDACGIVDNKYAMVMDSTAIEYEFVIVIIIINGHHVTAQAIATKASIITVRGMLAQLLIASRDATSDTHTVIDIKLAIAGTVLTYTLEIGSMIGMIDCDIDAIDAITIEIVSFGIIDYKLDGIDAITIKLDHDVYDIIDYILDPIDAITIISICIIRAVTSLLIVHPATFMVIRAFSAHPHKTDLFSFCLIIGNTCSLNLVVCILNTVDTILLQIAGT